MLRIIIPILFLSPQAYGAELIIWHVGQGQWISEIDQNSCIHYDMGGEFAPLKKVLTTCRGKKNFLLISHLDWDHVSFVKSFMQSVPDTCLLQNPIDRSHQKFRQQIIRQLHLCAPEDIPKSFKSLFLGKQSPKANDTSAVVYSKKFSTVFPGDSPKSLEPHWRTQASDAKIILLGHHGSRTSTAKITLTTMPHLKMAIASARKKKYGHPHQEVIDLLKTQKIVLLKTEDWGSIHIQR